MKKHSLSVGLIVLLLTTLFLTSCKDDSGSGDPEQYTITYNLDGGTNNASNVDSYTTNSLPVTLYHANHPGYSFLGWYDNASGDGAAVSEITGDAVTGDTAGNKTYWAKWAGIEHSVTYVLNSGTNNPHNPAHFNTDSPAIQLEPATRSGYSFLGWYKDDVTGDGPVAKIAHGTNSDLELNASWKETVYDVTYNLDSGTNSTRNLAHYSATDLPRALSQPTRLNYAFAGWYDNSGLTGSPITQISLGTTGNQEYWAKWVAVEYHILYNLDGGTNSSHNPAHYSVTTPNITLEHATPNTGNSAGKAFAGWYTEANGNGTKVEVITTSNASDMTLYAHWLAPLAITYHTNGGTNSSQNPAGYLAAHTITFFPATRPGFAFDGWFTEAALTNSITSTSGKNSALNLYAKWTWPNYAVGDTGPAGGIILYVNPHPGAPGAAGSWKYLEAAPASSEAHGKQWGPSVVSGLSSDIGAGPANTAAIVAAFNGDYAAQYCDGLSITNSGVTYDDWFLPSKAEGNTFQNALNELGGSFGPGTSASAWTSTMWDVNNRVFYINSSAGSVSSVTYPDSDGKYTRPVRRF